MSDCKSPADSPFRQKRGSSGLLRFQPQKISLVLLLLSLGCALGCSNLRDPPASVPGQRIFTDEAGRLVHVPPRIERLVSLAPNLTETVYAIGAGQRLVGNTTYCDYPEEAKHVAKVGDTLQPSVERILALRPQLILISTASQLEAFTQQLNEQNISVYVTDPRDLEGVYRSILNLGQLLNQEKEAMALTATLRLRTEAVERSVANRQPVKLFYQLSAEPLYTAGRDAFVTDIIRRAGGKSVTAEVPGAWPKYSAESALASQAEAIILPTGGSMGEANSAVAGPLRLSPAFTNGKIYKINDDHLTRPGPRAVEGLEALARALHPEAFTK